VDPIAVLYENEAWLAPLFAALENEGAPVARIFANDLSFDPAGPAPAWSLALNKVSPSSYLRAHAPSIRAARDYLPFLESRGVPVVNGSRAFSLETSKARQLMLLAELGIRAPAARVVTEVAQIPAAARGLRYPLIVKPNVGGSGALMRRVDSDDELHAALATIDLGPDGTGLVQEFLESADGTIRRVEFLDGEYLYAIKITNDSKQDFNLCPADICQVPAADDFDNCAVDAPAKRALEIEAFDPPAEIVRDVLAVARAGGLDVGGIEYLVSAADGLPYIYDINALSNFVSDAVSLVGFDPHARFARWLTLRAFANEPALAAAR